MKRLSIVLAVVALFFVACGGSSDAGHNDHSEGAGSEAGEPLPGAAGDASEADRTIEVSTLDQLRFDPGSIDVEVGEVVTFVVTNDGNTDHEFVLGDAAYQEAHGGEEHDMSGGNAVAVAPGETEELTWEFTEAGSFEYGCHVSGHYEGGMVGDLEVM